MSIEALKHNILEEKKTLKEIRILEERTPANANEKRIIDDTKKNLLSMLKILNNSVPQLMNNIFIVQKLPGAYEDNPNLVSLSYNEEDNNRLVTITRKDKKEFIVKLRVSRESLKKLKVKEKVEKPMNRFKKPSIYAKISNFLFLNLSSSITQKGYFTSLRSDIRKSNIPFMFNTYISIMFLSVILAFVLGIFAMVFLLFFEFDLASFIIAYEGEFLSRFARVFWIMFALPILVFAGFYFYPSTEKDSIRKMVNLELPFVAIHMSAIAGSGIEPTQIFKIISRGKEYKYTRKELNKVINQVNVYGYDLINALKNAASSTASDKLADLFNGMATNISTGGSLTAFLEKKSESLLFEYKLEREKYNKLAETFMDIYISIVVAAPMIMMLLMVLASVMPDFALGLAPSTLSFLIIGAVALLNLLFIAFLQLKQKEV